MYDPELGQLITSSFERFYKALSSHAPFLSTQVSRWARGLSGANLTEEEYFTHPRAFPMLLLPWWLEKTLTPNVDLAFQNDLVYATISYYYHVRLVDNLMDGHVTTELEILPILAFLFAQSQRQYQRYFVPEHPFWEMFDRSLLASCEATIRDTNPVEVDQDRFLYISAKKTSAVQVPLMAVCYRYERAEVLSDWEHFVVLFGRWHQMQNDLYDWRRDLYHNTPTYFLSEAGRRKADDESVIGWVIREGFVWAHQLLQEWMRELKTVGATLNSPDLTDYLGVRERMMLEQKEEVMHGLTEMTRLLTVFG
jgi:hypothetical protein